MHYGASGTKFNRELVKSLRSEIEPDADRGAPSLRIWSSVLAGTHGNVPL